MLMSPKQLRSVETKSGHKRHIIREGRSPQSGPTKWPICVCNFLVIDEDSIQEHDSVGEIENLCGNCKKRMVTNGS